MYYIILRVTLNVNYVSFSININDKWVMDNEFEKWVQCYYSKIYPT